MPPFFRTLQILFFLTAVGCSALVPQTENDGPAAPPPGELPVYRVTLIGDAGYAGAGNDAPIRAIARDALAIATPEITAYLGDNIYGSGMPAAGDPDRARTESVIETQLKPFADDTTMVGVFIPGNHDWGGMGPDGASSILRQAEFIRSKGFGRVLLLPDSAQPGPVLVLRTGVLQVIALDSQWWLHPFSKPMYPGAGEESATMSAIADSLGRLLEEFEGKVSIVLGHHPLETHGPHGGYFPVVDHVFPLRRLRPWLWLPLPFLGSAYPVMRSSGFSEQDVSNSKYRNFINMIGSKLVEEVERDKGPVFFAAGHEHSLQVLLPQNGLWLLVSGNGITNHATRVTSGPNTLFSSESAGYMTLDVYAGGGVHLKVIGVRSAGADPQVLYEKWIPGKT